MSKKKDIVLTPAERAARIKRYAEQSKRDTQAMIDDYNNPQSNTRKIIEALKDM